MYGAPLSKDLNLPAQPQQPATCVRTPLHMSSPGLLRYRSAPSTLLGAVCGDFLPAAAAGTGHRPGSPDHATDSVLARFLSCHHPEVRDKPPRAAVAAAYFPENAASMASHQQQLLYQSQQMAAMESPYRTVSSGGTEPACGGVGGNSLLRQSSSPTGFLDHLNMDNGYGNMLRAGMGAGAGAGGFRNGHARLKGQLSFSSRQGSVMSQISEMGSEELGGSSPEAGSNGAAAARGYSSIPGYPMGASSGWEDPSPSPSPSPLSESLSGVKRPRDVPGTDVPGAQQAANGALLMHQFSLPNNSKQALPEMAAIEKFLQFQDAVPCKIRAKRGCATHPRSIAERVRRTRISERIRKLQQLVPNMEKQTNTADMLDLAVDYIKDLRMQVKVLNDGQANCTCPASKQQQFAG